MTDEVVKALLAWAEASRKLGVARKNYEGENFQEEAKEVIATALQAKENFDGAFLRFVDVLIACG